MNDMGLDLFRDLMKQQAIQRGCSDDNENLEDGISELERKVVKGDGKQEMSIVVKDHGDDKTEVNMAGTTEALVCGVCAVVEGFVKAQLAAEDPLDAMKGAVTVLMLQMQINEIFKRQVGKAKKNMERS